MAHKLICFKPDQDGYLGEYRLNQVIKIIHNRFWRYCLTS